MDYNLILVGAACTNSFDEPVAIFMEKVFPRMARVRTTDQVLAMIAAAGR
jgi:hypothetical protein